MYKLYVVSTCIRDLLLFLDASWYGRRTLVYLLYHFDLHQLGHEWVLPLLWYHHFKLLCCDTSIRCPFCCTSHVFRICSTLSNSTSLALLVSPFFVYMGSEYLSCFRIYWINPLAYGYRAIVSNELTGQHYSCDGLGNAVPYGEGYDDWNYKVCTMQGKKGKTVFHHDMTWFSYM